MADRIERTYRPNFRTGLRRLLSDDRSQPQRCHRCEPGDCRPDLDRGDDARLCGRSVAARPAVANYPAPGRGNTLPGGRASPSPPGAIGVAAAEIV